MKIITAGTGSTIGSILEISGGIGGAGGANAGYGGIGGAVAAAKCGGAAAPQIGVVNQRAAARIPDGVAIQPGGSIEEPIARPGVTDQRVDAWTPGQRLLCRHRGDRIMTGPANGGTLSVLVGGLGVVDSIPFTLGSNLPALLSEVTSDGHAGFYIS